MTWGGRQEALAMKRSRDRFLTPQEETLRRPADLMALYKEQASAETLGPELAAAVGEVVRKQVDTGIDVVNDGEYGKPMTDEVDYGAWSTYVYPRLSGFEIRPLPREFNALSTIMGGSKDRRDFAEYYANPEAYAGPVSRPTHFSV